MIIVPPSRRRKPLNIENVCPILDGGKINNARQLSNQYIIMPMNNSKKSSVNGSNANHAVRMKENSISVQECEESEQDDMVMRILGPEKLDIASKRDSLRKNSSYNGTIVSLQTKAIPPRPKHNRRKHLHNKFAMNYILDDASFESTTGLTPHLQHMAIHNSDNNNSPDILNDDIFPMSPSFQLPIIFSDTPLSTLSLVSYHTKYN